MSEQNIPQVNPITREDRDFLAKQQNYALLGEIQAMTAAKKYARLYELKAQVNELRGIRVMTEKEATKIGQAASKGEQVNGKDLLAIFTSGRDVQKAFRKALTGTMPENGE